jgi:hypothetical protein
MENKVKEKAKAFAARYHDPNSSFFDIAFRAYVYGYNEALSEILSEVEDDISDSVSDEPTVPTDTDNQ